MNLTKTWPLGLLILGGTLWAIPAAAQNDAWQDVWQEKRATPTASTSLNWEQRALKRPQAASQGQPRQFEPENPRPTTQRWVAPQRVARREVIDESSMEPIPAPAGSAAPAQGPAMEGNVGESSRRGAPQYESIPPGSVFSDEPPMRHRGAPSGEFGGSMFDECGSCAEPCGRCEEPCDLGWEEFDGCCGPFLRGLSVFVGADAFKGPLDGRGSNGNFGFNEGLNLARPLGDPWNCGYQLGVNFVQSDFSGVSIAEDPGTTPSLNVPANYRRQYFVTAGLFRRAQCWGFQGGAAFDYLHDVYYQQSDLQQLRTETSYLFDNTYEIGYYGAYGISSDTDRRRQRKLDGKLDPTDMFVLFLRRKFENGGDGRIWAGATGGGDGLVGADLWVPLGTSFALENRVNYLIPKHTVGNSDQPRESWGFVIQLVWYPGQNAKCQQQNPYRPMFNVADNSLFMVDRLAK
jgi:hypothetical protein